MEGQRVRGLFIVHQLRTHSGIVEDHRKELLDYRGEVLIKPGKGRKEREDKQRKLSLISLSPP